MKLVRYGNPGKEKPGLIDADGKLRDLSKERLPFNKNIFMRYKKGYEKNRQRPKQRTRINPIEHNTPHGTLEKPCRKDQNPHQPIQRNYPL